MSATPYPQNLYHSGSAKPLTLDVALDVPPTGDITISVSDNAASKGWVAIPNGNKMVVTLGRATQYEAKYLVSSVSSGQSSSTLTVLAEDRNYDGTIPVNAPAGTVVEHTVSATEMATINDHMRTRQAHGSDGNLVDQNSAQALSNKTFATPTDPSHAATKQYVDTGDDARVAVAGDTMTGTLNMNNNAIKSVKNAVDAQDAVTKAQLDPVSTVANAALPKSGGVMNGNINMGGYSIVSLNGLSSRTDTDNLYLQPVRGQVVVTDSAGINPFGGTIAHADASYANQSATLGQVNSGDAGRLSRYGDTVSGNFIVANEGSLNVEGYMRVSDLYRPEDLTVTSGTGRRWLVYNNDGIVHRVPDTYFRLMILNTMSSSARLKTGIAATADIPDLAALQPKRFEWTDEDISQKTTYPGVRYGLIAEEVAAVDERLVSRAPDDSIVGLDNHALIAALVATVQDLQRRVDALEGN